MAILMDEAQEFCGDMNYTSAVADKPEMLGVNEFAESSIIIRFFIKTAANMQMPVKREMLRRIKNRFDKEGISIPFPHRVVINGDK
jgi:small-conductance mechanosensitive channel